MTDKERDALLLLGRELKDLKKANSALCGAIILLGVLIAIHIFGGV